MANSKTEISHRGKIVSITPELTSVEIISESACSACHAKGLCSLGESTTKIIEVATSPWEIHSVGEEVEVVLKASMGHKAVWIAYAVPLVVLMVVILIASALGVHELVAGISAIVAVAVYYFIVWLFRNKLRNEYIFNIKKYD